MRRILTVLPVLAVLLGGCSITKPVAVIADNGDILTGTTTVNMAEGKFQVSGVLKGTQTHCKGTYDPSDLAQTIRTPVTCDNGQVGIVTATREPKGLDGFGTVEMQDGTKADFIWGKGAEPYVKKS
ncbi:hypothetical protein HDIA_1963 [Hartmannibacter diazotrophicus]|uniref:Lipoprotein n=2 Tax=Hartmannibacter diazotrophicus TaxID=1482074 RepID=A0A2C9D5B6_9HYPH|nr:hypothetical protein HDIA_1963 [Hartmannibacter diazotrophicus]